MVGRGKVEVHIPGTLYKLSICSGMHLMLPNLLKIKEYWVSVPDIMQ